MSSQPIGIFDSGIGGVSVLRAVRELLPGEDIIYFGDSAYLPYGEKSMEEIRQLSERVVKFLLEKDCKLIVIACNTASAAALKYLRDKYPEVPFIGMEPAVKPAAEQTQSGVVGVIATTATFQGELFKYVVERFAQNVKVINQPCPGLVQQIEAGELDSPETEKMLRGWLEPMKAQGMDKLVLACTHYPFVLPLLKKILGEKITIIDPAPAIAKQVKRILEEKQLSAAVASGEVEYYTSGDPQTFNDILFKLTGENAEMVTRPHLSE
ncbi:MAG TPA: glutamate racemase [Bacteroidia bacterium]|jgi:glutamate racemase|nr:glutamate racemase [Bacteroidia bacterium]